MSLNLIFESITFFFNLISFSFLDFDENLMNNSIKDSIEIENLIQELNEGEVNFRDQNNSENVLEDNNILIQDSFTETYENLFKNIEETLSSINGNFKIELLNSDEFNNLKSNLDKELYDIFSFLQDENEKLINYILSNQDELDKFIFNENFNIINEHEKLLITENSKNLFLIHDLAFLILKSQQSSDSLNLHDKKNIDFFSNNIFKLEETIKNRLYNQNRDFPVSDFSSSNSSYSQEESPEKNKTEVASNFFYKYNSNNFLKKNIIKPLFENKFKKEDSSLKYSRSLLGHSLKKNFKNFFNEVNKKY